MYQKNENGYLVLLSENALISLVLSSLEAYAVEKRGARGKNKKELETYGSIYGQHTTLADGRTLFRLEMAQTDTTARQTTCSVQYSEEAISLKRAALGAFWPHLDYLGDFHSHPYRNITEARKCQGFYLSEGDRANLDRHWKSFWKNLRYRLGLVVTVAPMQRARESMSWWDGKGLNCLQFTIGNFRLWISAFCVFEENSKGCYTEDQDEGVELSAPALTGLVWEHAEFGKYKNGAFELAAA
ncbi:MULTISPECIES: hypothetical protein [Thiorhodovibrio]|uniref:hypothetical protein n=1 Tax=Thiorhodovibrio TaxID=61593 RepID=UPI001912359D|nr:MULTISPECIES: hypothetical protein [Thiorhodovibrio]MBK5970516.1 hypothetical protein [Thiorhodovibrio winogradskyi]WPL12484.1 hypothetical protein Thiosp_02253 [Thiorhodovibrio litoralis]